MLAQAPTVPKVFKDSLSDKPRGTITVPKLGDPGNFNIPVTIGGVSIDRALCDLGAGVSLMPYSLYKRLGNLGKLAPHENKLQLADRNIIYPDRKSTRLNSSHTVLSRMPSSA